MSSTSMSRLNVHGSLDARLMLHGTAGIGATSQSMFWEDGLHSEPIFIAFHQGLRAAVKAMGYSKDDDMSSMLSSIYREKNLLTNEGYKSHTIKFQTPPTCLTSETPRTLILPETWKQTLPSYSKAKEAYAIMTASDVKVFDPDHMEEAWQPVESSVLKALVLPDEYLKQCPSLHFAFTSTEDPTHGEGRMANVTDQSDLNASVIASTEMLIYPKSSLKRTAGSVLADTSSGDSAAGHGLETLYELAERIKNEKTKVFDEIRQRMQDKADEEYGGLYALEITDETPITIIMATPTKDNAKDKHTEWVMTTFSDGFHKECEGGYETIIGASKSETETETSSVVQ